MIFPLPLSALLSSPFFWLDFELPPLPSIYRNSLSCAILCALHSEIFSLRSKKSAINGPHEFSFLFFTSDSDQTKHKTTFMCEAFYIACVHGITPSLTCKGSHWSRSVVSLEIFVSEKRTYLCWDNKAPGSLAFFTASTSVGWMHDRSIWESKRSLIFQKCRFFNHFLRW